MHNYRTETDSKSQVFFMLAEEIQDRDPITIRPNRLTACDQRNRHYIIYN